MSQVKRIKIQYSDDTWSKWITVDEAKDCLKDTQIKACIIEECMTYNEAMNFLAKMGI